METLNLSDIAAQYLSQGLDLLQKKEYTDAINLFDKVIQILPEDPAGYLARSIAVCETAPLHVGLRHITVLKNKYPHYQPAQQLFQSLVNETKSQRPGYLTATDYVKRNPSKGYLVSAPWISTPGLHHSDQQTNIAIVKNVSVQGPEALLIVDQFTKLAESTSDLNIEEAWLPVLERDSFDSERHTRAGDWAVISGLWSTAFYHWMLEWLPKVLILEKAGFTGTYVIPKGSKFIVQSLELLGIPLERTMIASDQDWIAERLWITPSIPAGMMTEYHPLFRELRSRLLQTVESSTQAPRQRIYLSRRLPNRPRRVINEDALMECLSKYGFESFCFDDMDLQQQIEIFSQAEAVVAPHGAGILHTLFAHEHALVLEMFSRIYVNPVGLNIAQLLNHRYYMMPAYNPGNFNTHGEDIEAFIPAIELTVKRELCIP
jgi:hypothetical protein